MPLIQKGQILLIFLRYDFLLKKHFYNIHTYGKLFTLDLKTRVDITKEIFCFDSKKNFQSTPGELRYRAQGFVVVRRFGCIRDST